MQQSHLAIKQKYMENNTKTYKIEIIDKTNGKGGKKTQTAYQRRLHGVQSFDDLSAFNKFKSSTSMIRKFSNGRGVITAVAKSVPAVAVAYAIIKLGDKIATTATDFSKRYYGYSEYSSAYNNFKKTITNVMNPMGVLNDFVRQRLQEDKMQLENTERNRIIGFTNAKNIYRGF